MSEELIASERKQNSAVYERVKDGLRRDHMGEYAAIIGGKVFIGNSFEEVDATSMKAHPDGRHRYIFQIRPEETKEPGKLRLPMREKSSFLREDLASKQKD